MLATSCIYNGVFFNNFDDLVAYIITSFLANKWSNLLFLKKKVVKFIRKDTIKYMI